MKAFHLLPPKEAFEVYSLEVMKRLAETQKGFDEELYRHARALVLKKMERKQA